MRLQNRLQAGLAVAIVFGVVVAFGLARVQPLRSVETETPYSFVDTLTERHYDLGELVCGTRTSHTVTVHNDSKVELPLTKAESSCVCTVASLEHGAIGAGETGKILVHVSAPTRTGPFNSDLLLVSDEKLPIMRLSLSGRLIHGLSARPNALVVEAVNGHGSGRFRVLHPNSSEVEILSTDTALKCSATRCSWGDCESSVVDVVVEGGVRGQGRIQVKAGSSKIEVPIAWRERPNYSFQPNPIRVSKAEGGSTLRTVYILTTATGEVSVDAIKPICDVVEIEQIRPGLARARVAINVSEANGESRLKVLTVGGDGRKVSLLCDFIEI
jgi:hypothetical protein